MRRLATAALGVFTLVILVLTLYPAPAARETGLISLAPVGLRGLADTIANILLFVPVGAAAAVVLGGRRAVLAGAALSLLIELVQLGVPGRYTSPYDLLFNTLGAGVGAVLVGTAVWWVWPGRVGGRIVALTWLAGALLVLGGGGALFAPSVPQGSLFGQWTAEFGNMAVYEGRVTSAHVGVLDVPSRRIRESNRLRGLLLAGEPIRVAAVAGPAPPSLAPLLSIFDHRAVEMLLIGIDGTDVVFRYRMRATALRLDEPHVRMRGLLDGVEPGDAFELLVSRQGAQQCLRLTLAHEVRTRCGGYTVGDTWALLLFPLPRPLPMVLRPLWIAALLLPAGFWIRRSVATLAVAATLAVVALAAAPSFVGVLATPAIQLAAAAGGIIGGHALGRWVERRGPPHS